MKNASEQLQNLLTFRKLLIQELHTSIGVPAVSSRSQICVTFVLLLVGLCPVAANAGSMLAVTIESATIAPGGTGEITAVISGAGQSFNLAGYEFRITPVVGTTSQLQFLEESESFLSDVNYLFAGNSTAATDSLASSIGTVSTAVLPGDTFVGGDGTSDLADVVLSGSKLLVRIPVKHILGPADPVTTLGHSFSISLLPAIGDSAAFAGGSANTGFLNAAFNGVGFASQSATVTVVIPEPAQIVNLLVLSLATFAYARPRV